MTNDELLIPDDMFDRESLESERFLGRWTVSRVREGTGRKTAGQPVWYYEVENLTRPLPWGAYVREVIPMKGRMTYWTRLIAAFADNIGIRITTATIPTIEGRILWMEAVQRPYKLEGVTKFATDIYPVGIPTPEEIAALVGKIEEPMVGEGGGEGILEPVAGASDDDVILSCMAGATHDELLIALEGLVPDEVFEGVRTKVTIARLIRDKKVRIREGRYEVVG